MTPSPTVLRHAEAVMRANQQEHPIVPGRRRHWRVSLDIAEQLSGDPSFKGAVLFGMGVVLDADAPHGTMVIESDDVGRRDEWLGRLWDLRRAIVHAIYPNGLCDVGGCGNSATGPEVAIYVEAAAAYLEVSLCDDHPWMMVLARAEGSDG